MRYSNSGKRTIMTHVILFIIVSLCLAPCVWVIINSFKPDIEMFTENPLTLFKPTFKNYIKVWVEKGFNKYFLNSLAVAIGCTLLSLSIGVPAAYAFSRFKLFGKLFLLAFLLSTILVPPITLAVPLYFLFRDLNMLDSIFSLMIADSAFNIVFITWLMKGFFDEIPKSIEESAKIDGCSTPGSFWRIALRLAMPGLVTVTIFSFIFAWNDFLFALILTGRNSRTMTVAIPNLLQRSGTSWGAVCAEATIHTIAIVIATIFILKNLVRSLTFGAVKQ